MGRCIPTAQPSSTLSLNRSSRVLRVLTLPFFLFVALTFCISSLATTALHSFRPDSLVRAALVEPRSFRLSRAASSEYSIQQSKLVRRCFTPATSHLLFNDLRPSYFNISSCPPRSAHYNIGLPIPCPSNATYKGCRKARRMQSMQLV
jgi:hypothetical protein